MAHPNGSQEDYAMVTEAPDDWEFETVAEEAGIKVVFDDKGDQFIGQFEGVERIVPESGEDPFDLLNFRGRDGKKYSVNSSYKLMKALKEEHIGKWVRITYVTDLPSKKGNPMKDFRIDVRK